LKGSRSYRLQCLKALPCSAKAFRTTSWL